MLPAPTRRLISAHTVAARQHLLVETVAPELADGLDGVRLLALSVNRHAVRGLRNALHTRTGRDLPVADVRRRATALLEQFPAAAGLPSGWSSTDIISALDRHVLMQRAWAETVGSLYDKYSARPGALDWLTGIFDLFAEWIETTDPRLLAGPAPGDAALAELWAAYRSYLGACRRSQLVAFQEVVPRAVDVLRDRQVRARVRRSCCCSTTSTCSVPPNCCLPGRWLRSTTAVVASSGTLPSRRARAGTALSREVVCGAGSCPRASEARAAHRYRQHVYRRMPIATARGRRDCERHRLVLRAGQPSLPTMPSSVSIRICFRSCAIPCRNGTSPSKEWPPAMPTQPAIAPLILAGMRLIAGTPMLGRACSVCCDIPALASIRAIRTALSGYLGARLSPSDPLATARALVA